MDQKVNIINLGPLGFWDGVQSAPDENFTINGFGSLYLELKETLKNTVLGQGVVEQYLPDQKSFQIMEHYYVEHIVVQFMLLKLLYQM